MTRPRSRLGEFFVAPTEAEAQAPRRLGRLVDAFVDATDDRDRTEDVARATASVAVLARPSDAAAAGGAVALALTRGCAVVLLWGAEPPPVRAPATPAARRLASRLADRGHDAVATGRLAVVVLRSGIDEAVRAGSAAAVPAVLAVAAPRDDRVDSVLRGHDRAVIVGEATVAELAAQSVARLGVPAETLSLPSAPLPRALAASGVALVPPLRSVLR